MATLTTNLAIAGIDSGQAQQDVIVNEALESLDAAITETLTVTTSATTTLTAAQIRGTQRVRLNTGASGSFSVVLPAVKRLLVITNNSGHEATVSRSGSGTVAVTNGQTRLVYCDGTDVFDAAGTGSSTQPFDIHVFCPDTPAGDSLLVRVPVARAVSFSAAFAGSYAKASVAATASTVFTVKNGATTIGTITFAGGATSGTFATTSGTAKSLAAGDVLSITAPVTADATLANVGIVLAGTR